jgi:ABC-type antimicrobial peptide transport system permease subunit
VGGLGVSFLLRRARSSWLLLACVAVTVLLVTGLATVLWTFADGVVPTGALGILASAQSRSVALNALADATEAASDAQVVRAALGKAWPGVGFQMESALWANALQLPASVSISPTTPNGIGGTSEVVPQIVAASLDDITAQATLTAGHWPGPPQAGGPVPMALPATVAGQLHVRLGSVLTGTPQSGGTPVKLQVTGFYRPRDPGSAYWGLDLLPVSGSSAQGYASNGTEIGNASPTLGSTVSYGPAVVNPAAFGGALTTYQASWLVIPKASPLASGNIAALAASTSAAVSDLAVAVLPYGIKVTSTLPQTLTGTASTIVLTRSLFTIAALELLLLAGAALVLAARLLASQREEESALLRARGATRRQVTRPVLAEAVLLGAVAGLVGVLIGSRLTGVLAGLGNLRLEGYSGIPALAWLSAAAMLVLCVAVMVWPALRTLTPDTARRRRGRQARLAGIAWAGGDLALVALAAVAVWELRGYSVVAHPGTGSLGIDPVVAVAPALALAGVALIPLRGLPLLARVADKATDRERRLAAAMVSWQIARRPIRQAGPVLLVVIATATTTLALAGYASWHQSAADQAAFRAGSDVRVDAAGGVPPAAAEAISRAPGVRAATPASVVDISNGGQLIALDSSTAGNTILLRPDLSAVPLSTLWQRITPRPEGLALPGKPDRLEIVATLGAGPGTSAAEVSRELGTAFVMAFVQDASGGTYQIPAGPLPFDGKPHSLVFTLAGQLASYPVRLLGFSLTYTLPPYDPKSPSSAPTASLTIGSLAVADTASGPFGAPFAHGAALAAWQQTGSSAQVPTGPPGPYESTPPSDGATPAVLHWRHVAGGGQQLTFNAGHDPSIAVELGVSLPPGIATGVVAISVRSPHVIPAIATAGYLAANHLGVGDDTTVSWTVLGQQIQATVVIVASVANFPTVFGQAGALIVNLAELNLLLVANQEMPVQVTRWWLSTTDGEVPRLPAGLGLSVTSRLSQQATLRDNPLLTAPRQAMLAIGVAAVLLGVLGFSISVAASLRARRTQSAVFAALGVGKNAQAGQLCLEQCALSLPAAAAGLLAGIGLAELLVPAITLTTGATDPLPSALVIVPLGPAVGLAFVTAAMPVVAAALSVLRRPDPAAQLRAEAR